MNWSSSVFISYTDGLEGLCVVFSAYINCHLFVYSCRMKGLIFQLALSSFQLFIKVLHLGVKGYLFHRWTSAVSD